MRWRVLVVGVVAVLALGFGAGMVAAQPENYPGETYCQWEPAWPGGTYLGQMHRYHVDHYIQHARNRGWDVCETWAADQRQSAITGLRALGYTVIAPSDRATAAVAEPSPTPPPATVAPAAPARDPLLDEAVVLARVAQYFAIAELRDVETAARMDAVVFDDPRVLAARMVFGPLPPLRYGVWSPDTATLTINDQLRGERTEALAALVMHEIIHIISPQGYGTPEQCYVNETDAFRAQAAVWNILMGPTAIPHTDLERFHVQVLAAARSGQLDTFVRTHYHDHCERLAA